MGKRNSDDVYVAKATAHIEFDGRRQIIRKGVTRVRDGHPLLKAHPNLFKAAGDDVRFDVEDAQARPATRDKTSRQRHVATLPEQNQDVPYEDRTKADLAKAIKSRNETRPEESQIAVKGRANHAALVEALRADDEAQKAADEAAAAAAGTDSDSDGDPEDDDKSEPGGQGDGDDS